MKIIVLDDTCKGFGGTALTLNAIFSEVPSEDVIFVRTHELNENLMTSVSRNSFWVIGNVMNLNAENFPILQRILLLRDFAKIEFDYGFCQFRSAAGFKKFTGLESWDPMSHEHGSPVLQNIYHTIRNMAKHIFYMSEKQKQIHDSFLSPYPDKKKTVLSSCFSNEEISRLLELREKRQGEDNVKWAIVDGNGGWHTEAKGVYEAVRYAKSKDLNFELVRDPDYKQFLQSLSSFKGLIFLPIVKDTCPRLVIEARILGLETILNENVQHKDEKWFTGSLEDTLEYLLERPTIFFNTIQKYLK